MPSVPCTLSFIFQGVGHNCKVGHRNSFGWYHKHKATDGIMHRHGNDLSVVEAKIGEKQSRQSNSEYNFMQYRYVFFEKVIVVYNWVWSKAPEAVEFSRIFVLSLSITVYKVTFNCKLQKKIEGAGCTSCSPNNFVGSNCSPGSRAYQSHNCEYHALNPLPNDSRRQEKRTTVQIHPPCESKKYATNIFHNYPMSLVKITKFLSPYTTPSFQIRLGCNLARFFLE